MSQVGKKVLDKTVTHDHDVLIVGIQLYQKRTLESAWRLKYFNLSLIKIPQILAEICGMEKTWKDYR